MYLGYRKSRLRYRCNETNKWSELYVTSPSESFFCFILLYELLVTQMSSLSKLGVVNYFITFTDSFMLVGKISLLVIWFEWQSESEHIIGLNRVTFNQSSDPLILSRDERTQCPMIRHDIWLHCKLRGKMFTTAIVYNTSEHFAEGKSVIARSSWSSPFLFQRKLIRHKYAGGIFSSLTLFLFQPCSFPSDLQYFSIYLLNSSLSTFWLVNSFIILKKT